MKRKIQILTGIMFLVLFSIKVFAGNVSGIFRLEKNSLCVGDPIVVEFCVTNSSNVDYSFYVGGDYRFSGRHEQFLFWVTSTSGRDFTRKLLGNMGGLGTFVTIGPGETYVAWELLNGYVYLLPPGEYYVRCQKILMLDSFKKKKDVQQQYEPVTIKGELQFKITEYDRREIIANIARMKKELFGSRKNVTRSDPKPVDWALVDLSEKFQTGVSRVSDDAKFEKAVLDALPEQWNDRYYLEYELKYNRNWITASAPEKFILTFSVRNNANKALKHGFGISSVSVNGAKLWMWKAILNTAMKEKNITDTVQPGALVEISAGFNDYLTQEYYQKIVWIIDGFIKTTEVQLRR